MGGKGSSQSRSNCPMQLRLEIPRNDMEGSIGAGWRDLGSEDSQGYRQKASLLGAIVPTALKV